MPRRNSPLSLADSFEGIRSDYNAARENRFRRKRKGYLITSSGADFHYRLLTDYLRMIEYARAMDRDDVIFGSTIDRAVTNEIHTGMRLDIKTGNDKANAELNHRWKEWSENADECDLAGEHAFQQMEGIVSRAAKVDGDHLVLPTVEGSLQLTEGHLCRTPRNTTRNVIHGVMLDQNRKRQEFWLCKDDIDPWVVVYRVDEMIRVKARDKDGERQVFQIYSPKRVSQTRGVSAMAPIVDMLGMFEDVNFSKLVQQQIVSCFAVFRERDQFFDGPEDPGQQGDRHQHVRPDGSIETIEGIAPGMQLVGRKGEKLTGFSPSVPNAEFFPHMKLILTLIGINLGLPLVMVLMDASEANFSAFRSAVEQAKLGFRRNQQALIRQFHTPVYRWKVRQWMAEDRALRALLREKGVDIFGHQWNAPGWPYLDPQKDRAADLMATRNAQTSQRRVHHERGDDWDTVSTEIVEDNSLAIKKAKLEARVLNQDIEDESERVHWRELISLPTPDGVMIKLTGDGDSGLGNEGAAPPAPSGGGNKSSGGNRGRSQ
jgi:lambda family phage portal protein